MEETLGSTNTSTKQQWIAEQARENPERVFTSLHHLIDIGWMREAHRRTRKDAAAGVDGVLAADYETNLEANLECLLERMKSGSYVAPPVRRHYIPKPDGTKRPLGIPTFEDKIAQRAILMLMEPIYEADFHSCSYGFRPGQSAHGALRDLRSGIMDDGHRWIIDADIQNYFGSIDHGHLRAFLDLRIRDGVVRRMIDRWLKAGVLDRGVLQRSETGTPQGGVLSPLLSNLYLHHVLDDWFERTVKHRLQGSCRLVRFADDFVIAFSDRQSGQRVLEVLGKRLGRFGLALHPDKTRFVDFRRASLKGHGSSGTFDFLGFTHLWGRSRRGFIVVRQVTAKDRFARAVKSVFDWCKRHRHLPLPDQCEHLAHAIRGHCSYYGLTGNGKRLGGFRYEVIRAWRKWLARRSRSGTLTWERMNAILLTHPLPPAKVVHSIYAS